jgi:hypothetical protein
VYSHVAELLSKQASSSTVILGGGQHRHHHHHVTRSGSTRRATENVGGTASSSSTTYSSTGASLKKAASLSSSQHPYIPKRTVSRLTSSMSVSDKTAAAGTTATSTATVQHSKSSGDASPHQYLSGGTRQLNSVTAMGSGDGASGQYNNYPQDVLDGGNRLHRLQQQQSSPAASTAASATTGSPVNYRTPPETSTYTVNEVIRKRHYRTGLNIFNKKPEKGISYLVKRGFLENSPAAVSRFLITRKGLSKQMIGEYLGTLNLPFNMATLNCFALEMDFSGMQIDTGEPRISSSVSSFTFNIQFLFSLAQVPDLLSYAGRGAKDRTADGRVQPALLPVQSRPHLQVALDRHHVHPSVCHHPAQHGPAHAKSEAGKGRRTCVVYIKHYGNQYCKSLVWFQYLSIIHCSKTTSR